MKPWLIRLGNAVTDNCLYRGIIRRRQQLVLRQYDGRGYGHWHAVQRWCWEWWLDRFDTAAWHCYTWQAYVRRKRRELESWGLLTQHFTAQQRAQETSDECIDTRWVKRDTGTS